MSCTVFESWWKQWQHFNTNHSWKMKKKRQKKANKLFFPDSAPRGISYQPFNSYLFITNAFSRWQGSEVWLLEIYFLFIYFFAATWQCPNNFQIAPTFTFVQSSRPPHLHFRDHMTPPGRTVKTGRDSRISGLVKGPALFRSLAPPPRPFPPCCIFKIEVALIIEQTNV